ncbi:MAG: Rieske 2Fe-2S domain-containing protein [Cyanobacteria bacterium P01_H01_bin.121]
MVLAEQVAENIAADIAAEIETTLAAGGDQPDRFDLKEAWYPVFYVKDLDPQRPQKFTLLGQDLVIWWEASTQTWRAFVDRCPHRLVPLSQGRINEQGLLECPYHGWTFSGSGRCEQIPQAEPGTAATQSPRACAQSLPTAIAQDLLFIYPGQPDRATHTPIPIIPALAEDAEDAADWLCLNTFRDLPYDALTLLENVLDSSHVPFTHHKSVGNRATAGPLNLNVTTSDRQGFQGFWPEGPRQGKLGSQHTFFVAPSLMWHDLTAKQFGRTLTVVYATPIRKGECRLFARFPFKFNAKLPRLILKLRPEWFSHISQNAILEDDQLFLYAQERYLDQRLAELGGQAQFSKAFYLATPGDRYVDALHRWRRDYCPSPELESDNPDQHRDQEDFKPQPDDALLERYYSHTIHCQSCRGALRRIQQLQRLSKVGLVLSLVAAPLILALPRSLSPASSLLFACILSGLVLLSAGSWWGLSALEQRFYKGRLVPPRNQA